MEKDRLQYSDWIPEETIYSHKTGLNDILMNCSKYGGEIENLTVAAGTFHTCRIQQDSINTYWYAQVPFGIVKKRAISETSFLKRNLWSSLGLPRSSLSHFDQPRPLSRGFDLFLEESLLNSYPKRIGLI